MTHVAPRGWTDLVDAETFYPEDLPSDWRLTYYANAFDGVLLPPGLWLCAGAEQLGQWRADVHDGFHFYLEQPAGPDPSAAAARAVELLRPAALVVPAADDRGAARCLIPGADGWQAAGYASTPPQGARGDLRRARDWLEAQAAAEGAPPRLAVLSQPTSAELDAWRQLLLLLGGGFAPPSGDAAGSA